MEKEIKQKSPLFNHHTDKFMQKITYAGALIAVFSLLLVSALYFLSHEYGVSY